MDKYISYLLNHGLHKDLPNAKTNVNLSQNT